VTNNRGGARPGAGARKWNANSLGTGARSRLFAPIYQGVAPLYRDELKAIFRTAIETAVNAAPQDDSKYARYMRRLAREHALRRILSHLTEWSDHVRRDREAGFPPLSRLVWTVQLMTYVRPLLTAPGAVPTFPPPPTQSKPDRLPAQKAPRRDTYTINRTTHELTGREGGSRRTS
jgi:hypothetical protein